MLGCSTFPATLLMHSSCSFDISGYSEGCKQQADLLLLQVQLSVPQVVAKVDHGQLVVWQIVQLLHLLRRQPCQRQLLQLALILLLLYRSLHPHMS